MYCFPERTTAKGARVFTTSISLLCNSNAEIEDEPKHPLAPSRIKISYLLLMIRLMIPCRCIFLLMMMKSRKIELFLSLHLVVYFIQDNN